MRPQRVFAGLILAAGLPFGVACGGPEPVIGVVLPTSGAAAEYGESVEEGARLAVEELTAAGVAPEGLEVVWRDTRSEPERAAELVREVVEDAGARIVVAGVTSDEARAILPVIDEVRVVVISPTASAPELTRASRYFFRVYPSDELEGSRAGKFLHDELGRKSVLIVSAESTFSQGMEPEFRQQFEQNLHGRVVDRVSIARDGWQDQVVDALHAHRPEAVYVVGYGHQTVPVLRVLDEAAFSGTVVTTSAFASGEAIEEAGGLAEEVFFPLPPFEAAGQEDEVREFVAAWGREHDDDPDVFAAHGYDAMALAIQALANADVMRTPEIRSALAFEEFAGVTGPIRFDDFGDVKHYPRMYFVKDGRIVNYQQYLEDQQNRLRQELEGLLSGG